MTEFAVVLLHDVTCAVISDVNRSSSFLQASTLGLFSFSNESISRIVAAGFSRHSYPCYIGCSKIPRVAKNPLFLGFS